MGKVCAPSTARVKSCRPQGNIEHVGTLRIWVRGVNRPGQRRACAEGKSQLREASKYNEFLLRIALHVKCSNF